MCTPHPRNTISTTTPPHPTTAISTPSLPLCPNITDFRTPPPSQVILPRKPHPSPPPKPSTQPLSPDTHPPTSSPTPLLPSPPPTPQCSHSIITLPLQHPITFPPQHPIPHLHPSSLIPHPHSLQAPPGNIPTSRACDAVPTMPMGEVALVWRGGEGSGGEGRGRARGGG